MFAMGLPYVVFLNLIVPYEQIHKPARCDDLGD